MLFIKCMDLWGKKDLKTFTLRKFTCKHINKGYCILLYDRILSLKTKSRKNYFPTQLQEEKKMCDQQKLNKKGQKRAPRDSIDL